MYRPTAPGRALAAVLLTSVVPAAGAQAATVTVSQPCQVAGFLLTASLSGFTPNSPVRLTGDGISAGGTADATGSASVAFAAPALGGAGPGSRPFTITARDGAVTPLTASAGFRSANFAFSTTGGNRPPRARRAWRFSGLTPGRPVFGHFRFGGRTRADYRFGVARSPCGELSVRAPGIPVKGRVPAGRWTIQFDQQRRYSRSTTPRLTGTTTVYKVLKRTTARASAATGASGAVRCRLRTCA